MTRKPTVQPSRPSQHNHSTRREDNPSIPLTLLGADHNVPASNNRRSSPTLTLDPSRLDWLTPAVEVHGLYIHVPFCFHKCHYCDFYSIAPPGGTPGSAPRSTHRAGGTSGGAMGNPAYHDDRQALFVDRLVDELEHRCQQLTLEPITLFVGGGTPTLLAPRLWRLLLERLRTLGVLVRAKEFTVEANPETVTESLMRLLADGGVNRISIGAQSFHPHLLETLERWHGPASVPQAVERVRAAGIHRINLDLIFAIPGQTLETLARDLEAALALEPDHLSCYSLTYEPNTAMTQRLKLGRFEPIDEELERDMYSLVMEKLADAGFEHYEISNWAALVGHAVTAGDARQSSSPDIVGNESPINANRCRHNLIYWHNQNWLGLGPSAASHVDGHRWKNEPHLGRYLAHRHCPPTTGHEYLDHDASIGEQLMLQLRLRQGVPLAWIDAHLSDSDPRCNMINQMIKLKLLEQTGTHLRLTRRGLFVADAVIGQLL